MTESELAARASIESLGFQVLRNGWPDFLVVGQDGSVKMAVEVKLPGEPVKKHQQVVIDALNQAGIPTRVVREGREMTHVLAELDCMKRGKKRGLDITGLDKYEAVLKLEDYWRGADRYVI